MLKFALAGNPNCGKTTLFNALTGANAYVGNWPGVTVEKREGVYKKGSEPISIMDLPGIYSLSPYTPEEIVSRKYILDEKPDCVINIVDATNLERNLYLTTQILEIDVPVIIALNMADVLRKTGSSIDVYELEKRIGVPVVEISALKNSGIDLLMERAITVAEVARTGFTVLASSIIGKQIAQTTEMLISSGVDNPVFHAIKLLELDEPEVLAHGEIADKVKEMKASFDDEIFGNDFEAIIADGRYKYISKNFSPLLFKPENQKEVSSSSDKADKILTHKVWGIPIFLVILFGIFHLTFSENLLFLGSVLPSDFLLLKGTAFEGVFGGGAIYSPGVIIMNLLNLLLDTVTGWVAGWLEGSPLWLSAFLIDGVLSGIFAIFGFLPQILVLFLFFSILEDSGYMARVAFILDRIFGKFGLSGRAFMPMIMGFGCSVPAMMNTRTLSDDRERTATMRVIPFFSCGAKLPILTAISGGIIQYFNVGNVDAITYSMYVLGIITAIVCVLLMRSTTMKGNISPFIMELPAYHCPRFKSLMIHLWDKTKHFVEKAFTIILASTIVIWFLTNFSWGWKFLPQEIDGELINLNIDKSILGSIGMLIQPLFTPLGFGSQLNAYGWVFAVAAITGLIAKENVISTFGTLAAVFGAGIIASDNGVAEVYSMIANTGITIPALISFIAFNMTTIPCFAAVATAKAELKKGTFRWTLLFWLATSYVVGTIIYVVGSWWWTLFIAIALAVLTAIGISHFNKRRNK